MNRSLRTLRLVPASGLSQRLTRWPTDRLESISSQPLVLSRLREIAGDELFVRTPAGMQPTVCALAMAPLVHEALAHIELAISSARFDPANSRRRFTLAADDYVTAVIVPHSL
jgi:hypothetical protein